MSIIDNIASWWRNINRRRRISISSSTADKEWHTHISPLRGVLVTIAVVVLCFFIMLTLVGYTSILELLPAYRTAADRSREHLLENIVRIDSMERVINNVIIYNENVGLILEGKTPVARTALLTDTIKGRSTFTPSSEIDAALRAQIEGDSPYSLSSTLDVNDQGNGSKNAIFSAPIDGIIIDHFDLHEGQYAVRIAATSEAHVTAIDDGVVVMSLWSPEDGNMVQILHSDDTISIYRNLSQSLVSKGEAVKRGKIIGYNSRTIDNSADKLFEFEMWSGGKPINPERYIIF